MVCNFLKKRRKNERKILFFKLDVRFFLASTVVFENSFFPSYFLTQLEGKTSLVDEKYKTKIRRSSNKKNFYLHFLLYFVDAERENKRKQQNFSFLLFLWNIVSARYWLFPVSFFLSYCLIFRLRNNVIIFNIL